MQQKTYELSISSIFPSIGIITQYFQVHIPKFQVDFEVVELSTWNSSTQLNFDLPILDSESNRLKPDLG